MTSYSNDGFFNPAYHDSETLEIDRRSSSKNQHINPYTREDPAWRFDGADTHHSPVCQPSSADAGRVALGGWQEESWRRRDSIPMGVISNPGSPSWQHELTHSTSQINPQCDQSPSVRRPSSVSGNMTMRLTGITMNRMNMFPNTDPAFIEDAVRNEMEKEEQDLIKELVTLSRRDRIRTIRELPMCFEEKKHIRSQVLAFKTSKQSHNCTCFADYFENVTLCFRRCGYSIRSARQTLELWHGIMKEISGKFGTSVLSYFVFLKWLLMFNIFSFLVNFGFITIPLLVYDPSPNIPPNVSFRGLEILTGAGYISYTVMYYVNPASDKAWQLLCSWDFSITNERAVRQRKNNLRVQLKESLSEQAQRELLTLSEKLKQFGVYLGSWLLSTSLAVGCGASIYYLCQYEQEVL